MSSKGKILEEKLKKPIIFEFVSNTSLSEYKIPVSPKTILIDNKGDGILYISFDGKNFKEISPKTTISIFDGIIGIDKFYAKSSIDNNKFEVMILY